MVTEFEAIAAAAPDALAFRMPGGPLSDAAFEAFCTENSNLRIERDAGGEITIMAPVFSETGRREFSLAFKVGVWNERTGAGRVFSSSAGFTLPNGAVRSPDAAWIANERWEGLSADDRQKFARICPDFVIELRSATDGLKGLKTKMEEWRDNGCRLGFLIDPAEEQAYIYRAGTDSVEERDWSVPLSGEDVLEGFVLDLGVLRG